MNRGVVLCWGWPARLVALGFAATFGALAAWAVRDPATSWIGCAAVLGLAAVAAALALELLVLRVVVDDEALRRRSLRSALRWQTLRWDDVRVALLVASYQEGASVVHERTLAPERAAHVLLLPRAAGRRWALNRWMHNFDAVLKQVESRELVALIDPETPPPSPGERALASATETLERANQIGASIVSGFALVFSLLLASAELTFGAGLVITGGLVDLVIVAAGLLLGVAALSRALGLLGAAELARAGAASRRRVDWMLSAAGVVLGAVLLRWFVPRALAGAGEAPWVDWVLVAMALLVLYSGLHSWLRGR